MKKNILLLIFLSIQSLSVKAQLYFHNNTEEPVFVTYAIHINQNDSKYWATEGWFKVEPGDYKVLNSGIGFNDNIYYYASSSITDKKYEGEYKFLIHPSESFFIKNADKQYPKTETPEYEWRKFRHVNMNAGLLQTKYTIELNY